ncbi:hypothetical protein [Kitasatospora sp. NPDC058218]|uniref:hypothetical protein n=1 Tax=Kitasatospora sp. NPDC058218 TaxID=3346385 RepID=UPI0036DA08D7
MVEETKTSGRQRPPRTEPADDGVVETDVPARLDRLPWSQAAPDSAVTAVAAGRVHGIVSGKPVASILGNARL